MVGAPRLSYAQLLETNNLLQTFTDETYWLCVTRTVQESKLFPVPPYMLLSYLNAFYRYPSLLRKVESVMTAEEIGDRAREGRPPGKSAMGWGMPGFYLLGRRVAHQHGPSTTAGCRGRPRLPDGLLETPAALMAPQRRPHHQQGVRPPLPDSA